MYHLENFVNLNEPDGVTTICFAARLLKDKGVTEVFGPGTNLLDAIYKIFNIIKYGKKSNI